MYDNKIGDQGAIAIAKALEVNAVLKKLVLNDNKIGDQGAIAIADALKFNAVLKELWLYENNIGDQGTIALAEALKFNAVLKLEVLVVSWSMRQNRRSYRQLVAACREKGVELK